MPVAPLKIPEPVYCGYGCKESVGGVEQRHVAARERSVIGRNRKRVCEGEGICVSDWNWWTHEHVCRRPVQYSSMTDCSARGHAVGIDGDILIRVYV